jgi:hypothetical protein
MKIDPPSARAGPALSLRRGKQFFSELKRRNISKVTVAVKRFDLGIASLNREV